MRRFNDWLAETITDAVSTVWCAYVFAVLVLAGGVLALLGQAAALAIINFISSNFLQLVFLPLLAVGQVIQANRHKKHIDHLHAKVDALHRHHGIDEHDITTSNE